MPVCLCVPVCGQILMDGRSGEVSVSNMAVRVSWDRLQQMVRERQETGRVTAGLPSSTWEVESRGEEKGF